MLLTSGQVSVAVSGAVVFFCTLALFLSGYAIQQRTLRDLREAIKPGPKPSPKIFLPDRFSQSTTELPDGTIVILDDDSNVSRPPHEDPNAPEVAVVEVKPTVQGPEENPAKQKGKTTKAAKSGKTAEKKKGGFFSIWGKKGQKEKDDAAAAQKPMSRAERRRRIKEEIQRLAQGEERGLYQRRLW
ncbi:hypothetical protein QBC35DRAFT_499204 [Podospora australis]|uniref:Uncharacterized protein n=1 Tax=Podospora australis TaxID=1536484 RepID=A0AAN6WSH2_9PEZI|nr:hypothetical protein QBC35DRAFT_499204 [Podospora australis]